MRVLILGGTAFLGIHVAQFAMARGHDVTLFNRGRTNPGLLAEVETLIGDRDGQLQALRGRTWDVVIDTSGYVPRVVRQSADALSQSVSQYLFISSISVYKDFSQVAMDEDSEVGLLPDAASEDIDTHYGPLKALCEQEVQTVFGARALIVRPGLIVGPHDPTDRYSYWVRRFSQGGNVLVPGRPERPIQFIDARDLAQWLILLSEQRANGVFHATGPNPSLTAGEWIASLEQVIPDAGRAVWVDEEFLLAHQVEEWRELPLWISEQTNWPGFQTVDIRRAVSQGLSFRPLAETILDTMAWDRRRDQTAVLRAGLKRDKESDLLSAWFAREQ